MFDCQCGCGGCVCHSGEGKRCGCLTVSVGVVGVCAIVMKGSGVDGCLTRPDRPCGCLQRLFGNVRACLYTRFSL